MRDLYNGYLMELSNLIQKTRQNVEPKHSLTFEDSSTKDAFHIRSPGLGLLHDTNGMDLHADVKGGTFLMGAPSSESTISSLKSEDKQTLDAEMIDPGHKELSQYSENIEMSQSYFDTVQDMEDVLSDSIDNGGAGFMYASRGSPSQAPYLGGGSNISTSDEHDLSQKMKVFPKFDGIEVVGAKQRKGGYTLEEKLVGLKEYTVYQIKVWCGRHQWEIERRYRDFIHLYHQLKDMFFTQSGKQLPSPWENVEKESRRIFGVAPNLVEERSSLIQECLMSLIKWGAPFDTAEPLVCFLLPEEGLQGMHPSLEGKELVEMQNVSGDKSSSFQLRIFDFLSPRLHIGKIPSEDKQRDMENSSLGKSIRLIVQIHPFKPLKQLLEAQHYLCAGCYNHLDLANGLVQELMQNLVSRKPRLCEYMGQLFCSSCHSNETAVLPARVLHLWDFTPRPVSQLAKTYLDSIYDQPMFCISTINPHIFSKVPVLSHILDMRMKLSKIFSFIHCPARSSIEQILGSRRYLLESSDFFSLQDLVDLSKGPSSALPILMEDLLKRMHLHITQFCSTCHSQGKSCGAGLNCVDPFSLVFPFQEEDAIHCHSCGLLYHQACFKKLDNCACQCADHSHKALRR